MRTDRHKKILELINNNNIGTQEELADALNKAGYNVTQATVSRDIREMRLTKISLEKGKQKYVAMTNSDNEISDRLIRVFKEAVVKMDYAGNMVVIKTLEGMGMANCKKYVLSKSVHAKLKT